MHTYPSFIFSPKYVLKILSARYITICGRFYLSKGRRSGLRQLNEGKISRKAGHIDCRNDFSAHALKYRDSFIAFICAYTCPGIIITALYILLQTVSAIKQKDVPDRTHRKTIFPIGIRFSFYPCYMRTVSESPKLPVRYMHIPNAAMPDQSHTDFYMTIYLKS